MQMESNHRLGVVAYPIGQETLCLGCATTTLYIEKDGGQSGERSQRAFKRRIYSPNRLLNGIPTHLAMYGY